MADLILLYGLEWVRRYATAGAMAREGNGFQGG